MKKLKAVVAVTAMIVSSLALAVPAHAQSAGGWTLTGQTPISSGYMYTYQNAQGQYYVTANYQGTYFIVVNEEPWEYEH